MSLAVIIGMTGTPSGPPPAASSSEPVSEKSSASSLGVAEACMRTASGVLRTKLKPRCSSGISGRSKSFDAPRKYSTASMIVAGGLNEIAGRRISFMRWMIDCSIVRSPFLGSGFALTVAPFFSSRSFASVA